MWGKGLHLNRSRFILPLSGSWMLLPCVIFQENVASSILYLHGGVNLKKNIKCSWTVRLVPRRNTEMYVKRRLKQALCSPLGIHPVAYSWIEHSSLLLSSNPSQVLLTLIPVILVSHLFPTSSSPCCLFLTLFLFNHVSHLFLIIILSNIVIALDQQSSSKASFQV